MTEHQAWAALTYRNLADLLDGASRESWASPSLCEKWQVRHVVAHMTMPTRLTPEQFEAEIVAAGGDFTLFSDAETDRAASLPESELLAQLRSPVLHAWQTQDGNGVDGTLSHAVIHSLDVTLAINQPPVAPTAAMIAVLDQLVGANGAIFGLDLTGLRLVADDNDWSWGSGHVITADTGSLVALVSGRTVPKLDRRADRVKC